MYTNENERNNETAKSTVSIPTDANLSVVIPAGFYMVDKDGVRLTMREMQEVLSGRR